MEQHPSCPQNRSINKSTSDHQHKCSSLHLLLTSVCISVYVRQWLVSWLDTLMRPTANYKIVRVRGREGGVHDKIIVSCLNGSSHCWPRHPTPHRPYLYGTYVCVDGPLPWSRMSSPTFTLLLLHNCDKRLHNNSTTRLVCDTTPPLLSLPSPFQEVSTEWRRQCS